jgi:hypothetical protein
MRRLVVLMLLRLSFFLTYAEDPIGRRSGNLTSPRLCIWMGGWLEGERRVQPGYCSPMTPFGIRSSPPSPLVTNKPQSPFASSDQEQG